MKYCAQCGTPMSDDTMVCPKCHPEINNQPPQTPSQSIQKNTSNKIIPLISTNIILSVLTLIAVIIVYLNPPSINNTTPNNIGNADDTTTNLFNSSCPADQYGNHDWAPARCTEPAQCYNCNAYRDDKLGEHSFYTDDDGFCDCTYCGVLFDVYIASLD